MMQPTKQIIKTRLTATQADTRLTAACDTNKKNAADRE
jgi:hypothetical protein